MEAMDVRDIEDLTTQCSQCKGTGQATREDYYGSERKISCPDCGASGRILSSLGEELIDLIAKNLVTRLNAIALLDIERKK